MCGVPLVGVGVGVSVGVLLVEWLIIRFVFAIPDLSADLGQALNDSTVSSWAATIAGVCLLSGAWGGQAAGMPHRRLDHSGGALWSRTLITGCSAAVASVLLVTLLLAGGPNNTSPVLAAGTATVVTFAGALLGGALSRLRAWTGALVAATGALWLGTGAKMWLGQALMPDPGDFADDLGVLSRQAEQSLETLHTWSPIVLAAGMALGIVLGRLIGRGRSVTALLGAAAVPLVLRVGTILLVIPVSGTSPLTGVPVSTWLWIAGGCLLGGLAAASINLMTHGPSGSTGRPTAGGSYGTWRW